MKEKFSFTVKSLIRRFYYIYFRKKYVLRQIKNRKGECKNCGCCQSRIIPCKHFDKDKHCLVWKDLPYLCKLYPFDEKDKTMFGRKHCGFYWEE